MKWATTYYVKNGHPTGTTEGIKVALRVLCNSYGRTQAADFGPLSLAALQSKMIQLGMSRDTSTTTSIESAGFSNGRLLTS